ncbi:MAG: hypothetical protein NVSMB27_38970 [Ktedonobacteraceae bacterium]
MLGKALIDRAVDLLTDVAAETFPAPASRREFLDPVLFEALAQFGFAPPFLAVALLSLSELAMKRAVVLARAGGHKVGNADIYADHRG